MNNKITIVKENPCVKCEIKGVYENCKCVLTREYYNYQQGRADAIEEFLELIEKRITESNHGLYLIDAMSFAEQLKEQTNE